MTIKLALYQNKIPRFHQELRGQSKRGEYLQGNDKESIGGFVVYDGTVSKMQVSVINHGNSLFTNISHAISYCDLLYIFITSI